MATYLVEVEGTVREVYSLDATDAADAQERALRDGECVVQETMSVERVVSVRLEED